ncbi:hypothetical protein [Shewanella sp. Arc9-LZ]|nr:hypothetical protein [Shewanella sp. Arc9-LZ]
MNTGFTESDLEMDIGKVGLGIGITSGRWLLSLLWLTHQSSHF